MLLQRQFDLLVQSNHDKERARVSVIEARYKRFLDEDKRRRDRNSSLLQALDRIDSHTASLAAKTERMRSLRKHYEAFIAHSYPGWHLEMERSYCPLAAIAPAPNVMPRVTDVTEYEAESPRCYSDRIEFSDTQYHALPQKTYSPLATPLCRSDLALSSNDDHPTVGRSLYRTGSAAIRSASLSPSRVRDLSSQYDARNMTSSIRNFDLYSPSKSPDMGLSPRLKNESNLAKKNDGLSSSRQACYQKDLPTYSEEKPILCRPLLTSNPRFLEYDHGTSEADLNTSGDLLNLSNLSLSDDGVLNESEILESSSSRYSPISYPTFTSPRDLSSVRKNPSISLSAPAASVRHYGSPKEVFIPKRNASFSTSVFTSKYPKSILSPHGRKSDTSSFPLDGAHQILMPSDLDLQRTETLSPRRQKPNWQTLRPSYVSLPPRSTVRRSVTFSEPEYETPYSFRDENGSPYNGSYGSLMRHSPSLPYSNWESSDHERYLRDKQGREKDAFREKIERLKELIKENKDQEMCFSSPVLDAAVNISSFHPKGKGHGKENSDFQENLMDRDWPVSKSRRSSFARDVVSDDEDDISLSFKKNDQGNKTEVHQSEVDPRNGENVLDTITDKEQWSGQFNEKDEDAKENLRHMTIDGNSVEKTDSEGLHLTDQHLDKTYPYETTDLKDRKEFIASGKIESLNEKELSQETSQSAQSNDENIINPEHTVNEVKGIEEPGKASLDFTYMESQPQNQTKKEAEEGEQPSEKAIEFEQNSATDQEADKDDLSYKNNLQIQEGQDSVNEYPNNYNYEGDTKQQEWMSNEEGSSQLPENLQFNYEEGDSRPTGYENQTQGNANPEHESGIEAYQTETDPDQQSYNNYQSNSAVNQQPQVLENFAESGGYEQYQEPKEATDPASGYQEYSEDPNQYQQNYQSYPEDQQYSEQQDSTYNTQDPAYNTQEQAYTTQDSNNYQYSEDPNKAQYKYENQEYNYQENQDTYNYPTDPTYQQDEAYQQEPYQSDQAYLQDPNYSQDQQYQQGADYQQGQQYQGDGFDGSAQYQGFQPGGDDLSEETTPSADSNYQGQIQGSEASDQSQTLEQYRALLGADPSSEPGYSDSSEIENQMAAVVGLGGSTSVAEPLPATTATPAIGKGKATKKKPQLTRKQSSITAESVEGNGQRASTLPKTPEANSEPAAPQ